ncbi:MAG: hypothetical protein IKO99_11235 [Bacteroidales bacterium]|nr:hypothetical protein [Bacteroidales bacterium]MBR6279418.1 hypothetical protein [Bacteroidales bacterium]
MKNALIFTLCLVLVLCGVAWWHDSTETVKTKDFKVEITKLKRELDSVKANQDTLKRLVRKIEIDIDTVKTGNELIFKTMNENKNRSFFDLF